MDRSSIVCSGLFYASNGARKKERKMPVCEIDGLVKDLPGSLIQVYADGENVSVSGISPCFLVLRFPVEAKIAACTMLDIRYLNFSQRCYERAVFENVCREDTMDRMDYFEAVYRIEHPSFAQLYDFVIRQYADYISCRAGAVDNAFSQKLVGYPYEGDAVMAKDIEEWQKERKESFAALYREFLWLTKEEGERTYLGSQFCHNKVPSWSVLQTQMEAERTAGKKITLCLPYLLENRIRTMQELLDAVHDWCKEHGEVIEIVCNDLGYEDLRMKWDGETPAFFKWKKGALLDKTKKDPRLIYEWGASHTPLQIDKDAEDSGTIYLPFYRTNTSQNCTLYALATKGNRGAQRQIHNCGELCRKYVCIYPEHLNMLGIGNSLLAVDERLLENPSLLSDYVTAQHVKRIVWNLPLLEKAQEIFCAREVRE